MSSSDDDIGGRQAVNGAVGDPVSDRIRVTDLASFDMDPALYQIVGYARFSSKNINEMKNFTRKELMSIIGFWGGGDDPVYLILVNDEADIGKIGPICPTKVERDGCACYETDGYCFYP